MRGIFLPASVIGVSELNNEGDNEKGVNTIHAYNNEVWLLVTK